MEGRANNRRRKGDRTDRPLSGAEAANAALDRRGSVSPWDASPTVVADARAPSDPRAWRPQQYHWVVEIAGQVIGEVELVHDQQQKARLRRLRIDPAWQRTAALSRLVDCVQRFCRDHGQVRVEIEQGCAPRWVLGLLRRRGLHLDEERAGSVSAQWQVVPVR